MSGDWLVSQRNVVGFCYVSHAEGHTAKWPILGEWGEAGERTLRNVNEQAKLKLEEIRQRRCAGATIGKIVVATLCQGIVESASDYIGMPHVYERFARSGTIWDQSYALMKHTGEPFIFIRVEKDGEMRLFYLTKENWREAEKSFDRKHARLSGEAAQ